MENGSLIRPEHAVAPVKRSRQGDVTRSGVMQGLTEKTEAVFEHVCDIRDTESVQSHRSKLNR